MKKNIFKLILITLISVLAISMVGCTYRADGSVIQDVKFEVSYENASGEAVEIESTLKLYKTFAPKTTEHIINLVKDKFYNDTQVVFDNTGSYLILGSYTMDNGKYKDLIYNEEDFELNGEFKKNGFDNQGKLNTQTEGTLVMLREPDSKKGGPKYDSAKATFAIILSSASSLPSDSYTAFGKIDEDSLAKFKTMKEDLFEDANGYTHARYVGDRDETTDLRKIENGAYVNSYEYYELDGSAYSIVDKSKLKYEEEGDEDYELWEKISSAYAFDNIVIPQKPITAKNFKLK